MNNPRIIVSLDFPEARQAMALVEQLEPEQCRLKVGKELFTTAGPSLVKEIVAGGYDVFLDLKFHDIPNTVANACAAAAQLGVWMINLHASGGSKMMLAARASIDNFSGRRPLLIAVTVLTSLRDEDLREIGVNVPVGEQVSTLAGLAKKAALDGVVCSAQEVAALKQRFGDDFQLVTPGIRPQGSAANDQNRTMTPLAAIQGGSDYLVIGRPITRAKDPAKALAAINEEIASVNGD